MEQDPSAPTTAYLVNWFDDEALANPNAKRRADFQRLFQSAAEQVLREVFPSVTIQISPGLGQDRHSQRLELLGDLGSVTKAEKVLSAISTGLDNALPR